MIRIDNTKLNKCLERNTHKHSSERVITMTMTMTMTMFLFYIIIFRKELYNINSLVM